MRYYILKKKRINSKNAYLFETLLESKEPRIDDNMRMILKIDLSWCYYWQKDYVKSVQTMKAVEPTLTGWSYASSIVSALRYRVSEVTMRENLKNSSCDLTEVWP